MPSTRTSQLSDCAKELFIVYMPPVYGIFKKDFIYLFLEKRDGGGGRKGEKHQCVIASHMAPTGDLALQPKHVL